MPSILKKTLVLSVALVIPACGGKVVVDGFGAAQGASGVGGSGGATSSVTSSVTTGEGAGGAIVEYDAGVDGYFPPPVAAVYANSSDSLYVINPATNGVSLVGAFQGCDFVIDIAVNRTGGVFATTKSALFAVDPKTAVCKYIANGTYLNSLSFVPRAP